MTSTEDGGAVYSVILVDDDAMVRGWLRATLRGSEFHVAGEASSGAEALDLAERRRADVILVDFHLPDTSGTDVIKRLQVRVPACRSVMMTAHPEQGLNEVAREAGAQGSIVKSGQPDDLLETLRRVVSGRDLFDARHPKRPPGQAALSPREREVLRLVSRGSTNREIAEALGVGDQTVKTLLQRACKKLAVQRRAEAVSTAQRLGLI